MIIKCVTGMFQSNCYIVGNNGEGVVIDPGAKTDRIVAAAKEAGLEIEAIMLTHAHIDHMVSADELRNAVGAPLLVHEKDADIITDSLYNGSNLFGIKKTFAGADRLVKDGEMLRCGGIEFKFLHTPGHTPGSMCILAEGCVFTGDTLFRLSVGRTDLGKGNWAHLEHSVKEVLYKLAGETVVYPGHGESSTIGYEKENNPYIKA